MRSLSDVILESIKYALEKYEVKCDKTFSSVIKSVNSNRTYTVLDEGGIERKVKCCIPVAELKVGMGVWVTIPCGNLNDIHICGIN